MKYIIYIFSYNSKERTSYIYNTLKNQNANVKVLENSTTYNDVFQSPDTIDLGRENIGLGGFHKYILDNLDENIQFYGFFTNDIYGFSSNYIQCMTSNFYEEIGVLHSRVDNDMIHPWEKIIGEWNGFKTYSFIEGIVPFYSYKILSYYKNLIETPDDVEFYGTNDACMSGVSNHLGLYNIRIETCSVSHERSGVRKSVVNNFQDYMSNAGSSLNNFLDRNKKLKEIFVKYF